MGGHDDDDDLTAFLVPTPIGVIHRAINRYYDHADTGEHEDRGRPVTATTDVKYLLTPDAIRYVTGKTGLSETTILNLLGVEHAVLLGV